MQKKKIEYIEWLRVLSAFAVVGIHITMTQPNNYSIIEIGSMNYMILTSIYALVQWAVPVFLMITGNLLLHSKNLSLRKIKTMIARMAIVLLLFGSAFAFIEQVFENKIVTFSMIPNSILLTLEKKSWTHLWYLYVLIGIYIIVIPLKRFVENASNKEVLALTCVLLFGNFIIPTINIALDIKIETFMVYTQYITYIILGYVIGVLVEYKQGECYKRYVDALINRGVLLCAWSLASVVKIFIQCTSVIKTGDGATLFLSDRLLTLLQAISVYCLFWKCMDGRKVKPLVESISKCSFGIYLIHPVFINLLYKALDITPTNFPIGGVWLGIPILWIFVFGVSWGCTWILKRVPIMRKLL